MHILYADTYVYIYLYIYMYIIYMYIETTTWNKEIIPFQWNLCGGKVHRHSFLNICPKSRVLHWCSTLFQGFKLHFIHKAHLTWLGVPSHIILGQGLVTVPFWEYWTSPYSGHYRPYTQWLGDVQWGHLMTHVFDHIWPHIWWYSLQFSAKFTKPIHWEKDEL